MSALQRFLNAYRTASKNCTHPSLVPNGKYMIPDDALPQLYDLIGSSHEPPHILETHYELTSGPLLIDLDFEYPDEPRFHRRQYSHAEVRLFVETIHSAVEHFFGTIRNIEYVVSEKPAPTIEPGKRVKDGIHIIGLGIIMTYKDQHALRSYALEKHFLQNSFCMDYVQLLYL